MSNHHIKLQHSGEVKKKKQIFDLRRKKKHQSNVYSEQKTITVMVPEFSCAGPPLSLSLSLLFHSLPSVRVNVFCVFLRGGTCSGVLPFVSGHLEITNSPVCDHLFSCQYLLQNCRMASVFIGQQNRKQLVKLVSTVHKPLRFNEERSCGAPWLFGTWTSITTNLLPEQHL